MSVQYNNNTPQPTDIPSASQNDFLTNFKILNDIFAKNHVPFGNLIEHAARGFPTVITSKNHGLVDNDQIVTSHTRGIYNGVIYPWGDRATQVFGPGPYLVTVIDKDTFSVPEDSSTYIPYKDTLAGDFRVVDRKYGWHTLINFPAPNPPGFTVLGKKSVVYTNVPQERKHAQLFFTNSQGTVQLTSLKNDPVNQKNDAGTGLRTPWGYIINFGIVEFNSDGEEHRFPIPYTSSSTVFSIIACPTKQVPTSFFNVEVVSASRFKGYFLAAPIETKAKCFYFAIGT